MDTYIVAQRGKLTVGDHSEFETPEEAVQRASWLCHLWTAPALQG